MKHERPPAHAEIIKKALDEALAAGNITPEEAQTNYQAYLAGALGKLATNNLDKSKE